ncbi:MULTISPECIES: transcriptional activator NhaR [unclassified Neptuniibacter]|jgi:LysR family transcriptional activator of nhaA|uniref:transcriptional activator NhaR n=1 Tax=unclassified Neptuniibacter TaxID=2630693 RepID=UPI0026E42134|nr:MULTISPECIES: transcriptional activator NhaR [unclassified Neptuniibacter]MDO6515028.1 transcriptional activator NhaR [Neptuniibacter sp. 2_MG-2023]MDO6594213.1 transcriptional activator NhaR [Neptuniibacter sp. 1_MG-2023]
MINYKHLHYFWMVAKEGSIVAAAERLSVTPHTISAQLSLLDDYLGCSLFTKVGRQLELTETGHMVLSYATDIFSLGGELEERVRNLDKNRPLVFKVGVVDVVPKSIAYLLLSPAIDDIKNIRMICHEGDANELLAQLALHRLDLVISESPIPTDVSINGFSHSLGRCGSSFMAHPDVAAQLSDDFPNNLNGSPMLLPGETTIVRSQLLQWFSKNRIHPRVIGEFDDSALIKAFANAGKGIMVVPTPIKDEVTAQLGLISLGETDEIVNNFYAISIERKISHTAVEKITASARDWLD